ncbi:MULTISPECIES: flavodoxin domain-containing protein [Psychrilyobacter]|uniref:DUF1971 domain-containing protein n=1 Tax=Psychrilyobacter piezotolerans TaxID=2293438 RepID=A0ABX9KHZ1_9FUSO|nr:MULTISPECIES: flavodoxin domain-containing protein [Psychrilyobacter]MCS5421347.1 flavodoxin domain-containing protein [Psychrilyobacter sp. S5]NDI77513.1 DUF1971 domain-containing protein [Psychrilyobacter piezotolerans]RDE62974.1 DUF1971 domain-containing protein [Psychrilyobacter sp. S5]REI41732.1 DUF1971 domain-containing protein [Psychrilyobacter piezotolerans]
MLYILYYTETGNTERVALKLKERLKTAVVANINDFDSDILKEEDTLILGCAAYGDEELSAEMEIFVDKINYEWNGKTLGLFGSYGSGDGTWMDRWVKKMDDIGAKVVDNGLRIQRDSIEGRSYDEYAGFFKEVMEMKYSKDSLPKEAVKVGETPFMTGENVFPGILEKHMAPKEKYGYIVVEEGSLDFVWEDNLEEVFTVDKNHPFLIEPERYHHVIITEEVKFKVEFYKFEKEIKESCVEALRPGESFIK